MRILSNETTCLHQWHPHWSVIPRKRQDLFSIHTRGTILSCPASLPIQTEVFTDVPNGSFFSGLLPDEPIRTNIARILKISPRNTFEMLKHLGGDCAGVIQILPIESSQNAESNQRTQPLSNDELFSILQNLPQRPLGIGIEGFVSLERVHKTNWYFPRKTISGLFPYMAIPLPTSSNPIYKAFLILY